MRCEKLESWDVGLIGPLMDHMSGGQNISETRGSTMAIGNEASVTEDKYLFMKTRRSIL